jgi:DNA recombination protein Rad52
MFTDEQKRMLDEPLNREHVRERSQAGRTFSYLEGWRAISEANRIFGFDNWTRETIELKETNRELLEITNSKGKYKQWRVGYLARVRIVVGKVVREGVGFGSGMGKPEAIGDAIESASKEAETDAMKRALMTFGNPFGLALYDKEQTNVETPHPLASHKAAKPAVAKAFREAGITDGPAIKAHVTAWVEALGAKAFEDTTGEQRQSLINDIRGGKYQQAGGDGG